MKKAYFLPNGNAERGIWLTNLNTKLTPELATKLGLSQEDKTSLENDTAAYTYGLLLVEAAKTFEHQCVNYLLGLRNGLDVGHIVDIPEMGTVGVKPIPVGDGIFYRTSKLVKKIKVSAAYNDSIGKSLGIIGAEQEAKWDIDEVMPVLTGKMVAGEVHIKYIRNNNDGLRLECRRGDETSFTLLDKINKTIYIDKRPNLVFGQPEKREYRAWFFVGDKIVGQVSAVITVIVTM